MASLERRSRSGRVRWYARFRDPSGSQVVKVFDRKVDGERYLATVEASKLTGSYIDAKRASITFAEFAEEHWAAHSPLLSADTTRVGKRSRLDRHILPALGRYPVGAIRPSNVAAAVGRWSQSLAPGTVGQVLRQVRQILDAAVADGLLASHPAKGGQGACGAAPAPGPPDRRRRRCGARRGTSLLPAPGALAGRPGSADQPGVRTAGGGRRLPPPDGVHPPAAPPRRRAGDAEDRVVPA